MTSRCGGDCDVGRRTAGGRREQPLLSTFSGGQDGLHRIPTTPLWCDALFGTGWRAALAALEWRHSGPSTVG
jgi:hypothetical protein